MLRNMIMKYIGDVREASSRIFQSRQASGSPSADAGKGDTFKRARPAGRTTKTDEKFSRPL
jgi:hypothetical protein